MDYFKQTEEQVLFNKSGYEMVYIIPEKYYETNVARQNGIYNDVMGLFYYAVVPSREVLDIKKSDLKIFRYPTMITCKPYEINRIKDGVAGVLDGEYRLLRFKDGDELISSRYIIQNRDNSELFFKMILGGRYPKVPYNELHDIIIDNLKINGINYDINSQIIGIIISELCRSDDDISIPLRLSKFKSLTSYNQITITEVGKYMSPFTSITSENFTEALMGAVLIDESESVRSPFETIFTGI